jgi:hypothetical protein
VELVHVEGRVGKIESLLRDAQHEVARLRQELGVPVSAEERWGRMMLGVLEDIDRHGGTVSREEVLSLGERHGYSRRGMAGFYQSMLELESGVAKLTKAGRARMKALRQTYARPINESDEEGTI